MTHADKLSYYTCTYVCSSHASTRQSLHRWISFDSVTLLSNGKTTDPQPPSSIGFSLHQFTENGSINVV